MIGIAGVYQLTRTYLISVALFSLLAIPACLSGAADEEPNTATMCYAKTGTTVTVNCRHDSIGTCESDGKTSLGSYDTWDACWDDTDDVLKNVHDNGTILPGPHSKEAGGGSTPGGGGGSYDWSFTCSDGVGGTKTLPIPKGACETQYQTFGRTFGCNMVGNFYSSCVSLYTCLVKNVGASYQQNLDACRNYQ